MYFYSNLHVLLTTLSYILVIKANVMHYFSSWFW